ncbi:MAG: hypothetical protein KAR20_26145 [Candidatus Heimdallarchaeota archaeon]|nr:hypothetical protein [Candidatus Heimdallarchaeota archaeon]
MIFLTPKQNQQRNAIVLVIDFSYLKNVLKSFFSEDELNTVWHGILHDYIIKFKCLTEHATCFYAIDQNHKFTIDEKELFGRTLTNWEQLELNPTDSIFALAKHLKSRNFKQITFLSSLVPSISPVILIDVQEWLWEVDYVLGPDTDDSLYMLGFRLSEIDEMSNFRWQDRRLFGKFTEAVRSKGKLAQPLFYWKQMKSLDDLEHYYQFFASIAGINPKYNGFDGFHTWEAINQITDGKNLGNCEKFLKAQMASIEKRKKIIERELIVESLHTLNDHEDISSKQAQSERNEKAIPISDIIELENREKSDTSTD